MLSRWNVRFHVNICVLMFPCRYLTLINHKHGGPNTGYHTKTDATISVNGICMFEFHNKRGWGIDHNKIWQRKPFFLCLNLLLIFPLYVRYIQLNWKYKKVTKRKITSVKSTKSTLSCHMISYINVYNIHTDKSYTTFFRRHCFGSCRTEYVGNGNHIFWILLQILLLLWALRAKNDLVNQVFG